MRDAVARRAAVQEEQVVVVEAGVREALRVVDLLVQPDDGRHVVLSEVGKVRLRRVQRVTCRGRSSTQDRFLPGDEDGDEDDGSLNSRPPYLRKINGN